MANKKITDLQLVDQFSDDLNLPVDDTIQTYRSTGSQVKSYVRKCAVSSVKTSTYSADPDDELILVDGTSAFTVTLPTAVGRAGKVYSIKRVDQTLANAVTIATTSSQTIDGITTRKLMTQFEQFTLVSDGANWQIVAHLIPSFTSSYTPTIGGVGTVSALTAYWQRVGNRIKVRGIFTCGSVPAATNLTCSLPSGLSIAGSGEIPTSQFFCIGEWIGLCGTITTAWPSNGTGQGGPWLAIADTATDATKVYAARGVSSNVMTKMAGDNHLSSGNVVEFNFECSIANWEP